MPMAMPRVLVTSDLPGDAVEVLSCAADVDLHADVKPLAADELLSRSKSCDGLVCLLEDQITDAFLSACGDLKIVANVAVGYDNIDIDAATRHGVLVTNTPGVLDETTADLAFGLLLSSARRIAEADRFIRAGRWHRWEPDLMLGTDVHGKTLGLIGYGRIGKAMARRALGFGMTVLYARRVPPADGDLRDGPGPRHVAIDELLATSDFISIHCPLNDETRYLIGERELSILKPCSVIVNTSRGALIDQKALIAALADGRVGAAGLDVFEDEPTVPVELLAMEKVVLTPHIGSASIETRSAMARLAVDGLVTAFSGIMPPNAVNGEVWDKFLERAAGRFANP